MDSCPKELEPFIKAHKLRGEQIDSYSWVIGAYVNEAVSVAIANAFRKKGAKPHKYRDKPYSQENLAQSENLTDEQKKQAIDRLFRGLSIKMTNFNLAHQNDSKDGDAE